MSDAAGITTRTREQAETHRVSIPQHRPQPRFSREGSRKCAKGLPFNPDEDEWEHERGRSFGFIAPLDMPLRIGGRLNPKALKLAEAAFSRKLLI